MEFPANAKRTIASAFYDKEVSVLGKTEELDEEGGIVKATTSIKSTFKGNVRFITLGQEQEEIGLVEDIDIQITCPTDTEVQVNDLIRYRGVVYTVVDVLPFDSHLTITGRKWDKHQS